MPGQLKERAKKRKRKGKLAAAEKQKNSKHKQKQKTLVLAAACHCRRQSSATTALLFNSSRTAFRRIHQPTELPLPSSVYLFAVLHEVEAEATSDGGKKWPKTKLKLHCTPSLKPGIVSCFVVGTKWQTNEKRRERKV